MSSMRKMSVILGVLSLIGALSTTHASEVDERANSAVIPWGETVQGYFGNHSANASDHSETFSGQGSATAANRHLGAAASAQKSFVYSNAQWQEVVSIKNSNGLIVTNTLEPAK